MEHLIWQRVLVLQALSYLVLLPIGRVFLGLSWRSSLLAVALAMPVPLFKVSPGTAGLIFSADLVALWMAFLLLLGLLRPHPDCHLPPRYLTVWAAVILIVLPALSTAFGYIFFPEAARGLNYIFFTTARYIGYMIIFWAMARRMQWELRPDRFLTLQCFTYLAVTACGLVQYVYGYNLDLWYEIQRMDKMTVSFGGGFMGLYRGAVGAYGVGILVACTMLLPHLRFGLLLSTLATAGILGTMLAVGSRQGIAVGTFAFILSLIFAVRGLPQGMRVRAFLRSVGLMILLGVVGLLLARMAAPDAFKDWVYQRFAGFESMSSIMELAANRDPEGMRKAVENLTKNPVIMFTGLGEGTEARMGRIYVKYGDHELLNVWQVGGLPLLLSYIIFMLLLLRHLRKYRFMLDPANRLYVATAFVVLVGSLPLLYGHFFLLNSTSGNGPVGYWHWALFGGAVGVLAKPEFLEASDELDYLPYPESVS